MTLRSQRLIREMGEELTPVKASPLILFNDKSFYCIMVSACVAAMLLPGWAIRRSTIRLLLLIAVYSTFLLLGASIFSAIENPGEAERVDDLRHSRANFLKKHFCVGGKFKIFYCRAIWMDIFTGLMGITFHTKSLN